MTQPLPETSHAEGAISAPAPPTYRAGRRDLGLGVMIGVVASVAVLLPALVEAFGGGDILPALTENGLTVVLVLLAIVIVVWAVVDGIPAWRSRTSRVGGGGRPMNLNSITAKRPRALLVGIAAGLLLGLGAVQGVLAINKAANPGGAAPETGAVPNVVAGAATLAVWQ